MPYLIKRDYFTEIRETDLDEILTQISQETAHSPNTVRLDAELDVIAVVETKIRHRFDVAKIFKDIIPYADATAFQIGDVTQYTESKYDPSATYSLNDRVSHSFLKDEGSLQVQVDDIFNNTTAVTSAEDFDISKWTKLTENGSIYFCEKPSTGNKPDTAFSFTANAFTGNHDLILGWDKTKTIFFKRIDPQVKLYYLAADRTSDANSIGIVDFDPVAKKFPDNRPIEKGTDAENNVSGDLSFIGFVPDATTWDVAPSNFFIKGDNRDRVIRKIVVTLVVYELHKLISPRNIPDLRLEAKDDAMSLLNMISRGEITADLPLFHDESRGQTISFGGEPANTHRW